MITKRFIDEYQEHVLDVYHTNKTIYDEFNTSSSSTEDDSEDNNDNELVNEANITAVSEFFKRYLLIPKEYREMIELKIAHPEYSHGQIARELGISRKHLYFRYFKMSRDYPELIYFTHRLFKNNPKRAFNSKGILGGEQNKMKQSETNGNKRGISERTI